MLEIKIINGSNFIIIPGMYSDVKIKGVRRGASSVLKNSISSNKFNIIPKLKKNRITLNIVFKYPLSKY
tara:strand:+ start:758 stop:964 length:207 start_codon:yes stop_codon:yes gene_type:complete